MIIAALGPLEAGAALRPRDRRVLAALVVRCGGVVTRDELADALWGATPPDTWWQQVKTSVASIRSELGADAVRTDPRGYALGLDQAVIDTVAFEQQLTTAREYLIRDLPDRAAAAFGRALDLWRGAPFDELTDWPPARTEAERLTEMRSTAQEELLDARLRSGESAAVVADAEQLVREEPLREARWAILALANYRADRQAEALSVLRRARSGLLESLGVEPGARLTTLERAILRQDPLLDEHTPVAPAADCPYLGLRAFDGDAADRFFGREADTQAVLDRLRAGAVVTIVGASGCGKSSLMLAGVLPAVRAGVRSVQTVRLDLSASEVLRELSERPQRPDVIAIDKFEEFFSLGEDPRGRTAAALARLVDEGATVLLTLRSDHLDRATALPAIGGLLGRGVFALAPIDRAGLRAAIERPAAAVGLRLEAGLVEVMLRDAEERPAALPLLSHALVETWRRREGSTLTVQGYEEAGGIAGAIARAAEGRFQQFTLDEQQGCRSLLMRLLARDTDGGVLRRRIGLTTAVADPLRSRVVEQLVASRLLAVDGDTVVVAHEAVASAWPRLLDWLNTDAEDAGLLRRVEEGAAAWDAAGRIGDDLPRGGRLAALLEWRDESAPDLTAVEGDYLRAAETAQRSEIAELAARAVRQRRQNRLLRGALVAAAALLITALAAGGLAMVRERDASAAEQDARIEAVAASARDLIDSDRDTAAILAAELYRRHPDDVRARSTLFAVLSAPIIPTAKAFFGDDQRVFGVPLPGGREVLVSSDDVAESDDGLGMRLSVWDLDDGTRVREFPARLPDASTQLPGAIHLTPDGTRAIVAYPGWKGGAPGACCSTTFVTVDLSSGEIVTGPTTIEAPIASEGSFTADGSTLVLRADDKPAPFFLDVDTLTGQQLEGADPGDGRTGYRGVTVLTDGRVAAGAVDGLDLYDAASREPVGRIPLPGDYATRSMRDLGDGTLLSAGEDGMARVEFASGRVLWTAAPGVRGCFSITPLPGGTFFCDDGVPWEASISDGQPTAREIQTQATWVFNVAAFDDGSLLVTNQRSTPFVERVPLDGSGPISRLVARGQVATDSGFADDRTIVTVPAGTVANEGLAPYRLWDLESDTGTGPVSDYIDVLGHGVIGRWDEATQSQVLSDVDGGLPRELSGGLLDGVPGVVPHGGATPDRAFAVTDTWVQPFDPTSGKALGPPLRFDGEYLAGSATVHDWAGSNRALVTWWDRDEAQMISAVFDLTTGKEIARGLYGDVAAIAIPDGRVFSTGSSELRQSDEMLQPQGTLPKPVAGANMFELSDDGRTLLLTGIDEYAALYDVPSGQKLGSDLAIDSPQWVSAHLSPDGQQLITNAPGGVLLWNLRTAGMAEAACRMAGRSLSPTEWATYFGGEARVDTCAGG